MRNQGMTRFLCRKLLQSLPIVALAWTSPLLHAQAPALTAEQLAAADSLAASGETEKAVSTYRFIAKNYPSSKEAPTAQYKLAKQLHDKGDFEAAFNEYLTS